MRWDNCLSYHKASEIKEFFDIAIMETTGEHDIVAVLLFTTSRSKLAAQGKAKQSVVDALGSLLASDQAQAQVPAARLRRGLVQNSRCGWFGACGHVDVERGRTRREYVLQAIRRT